MLLLALYVGNSACAPCHAEILRQYSATPMARSSGVVAGDVPTGSFRHPASKVSYSIDSSGAVAVTTGARTVERKLEYFIGSGAAGRSYLYSRDGFLFQAPLTWYSRQSRWDVSPGYEDDAASRWNRAVEPDCLLCHASQIRSAPATQNRYASPPFAQRGIGCERCHGPGSEHIEGRASMVNPATLKPRERDGVCAQCHMSGQARITRAGKDLADYRPGQPLSSYVAFFTFDNPGPLKATSYVERLAASRCKMASGDALWCGTCHHPHTVPAEAERVAWFRAKCLTCHQAADCGHGAGDCAACHMPKGHVVDGGHGVLTDHGIPRVPNPRSPRPAAPANASWKLQPFSPFDTGDRELGLAYAEVAARTGDTRQFAEADRRLSSLPPGEHDAEVDLRLADLYRRKGDASRAFPLYQSALRKHPASLAALVNLGLYHAAAGRLDEAIALWRQALKLNPCSAEAGSNLAIALKARSEEAALQALSATQAGCIEGSPN